MNLKKAKSFFAVTLLSIICLSVFSACGKVETPTDAVLKALTATKIVNKDEMNNYFNYEDLMAFDKTNKDKSTTTTKTSTEYSKLIFSKLSYKIISSSKDGDITTVKTEITNTDMVIVMTEYITDAMTLAASNALLPEDKKLKQEDIDKKIEQLLIDKLSKKDNKKATTIVDIKLTKKDNNWKITMDKQLQDAITGGLSNYSPEIK